MKYRFDGTFSDWLFIVFIAAVYLVGKIIQNRKARKKGEEKVIALTGPEIWVLNQAITYWSAYSTEDESNPEDLVDYLKFLDRLQEKINE